MKSPDPHWFQISPYNVNVKRVPIGHNVAESKGRRPVSLQQTTDVLSNCRCRESQKYVFIFTSLLTRKAFKAKCSLCSVVSKFV